MNRNLYTFSFKYFLYKYAIPFLFCIIIFLISFNIILEKFLIGNSTISGAYKVERLLHHDLENEIPILGSSRAEGSVYPDSLGKHIYNYGLAGVQDNVWIYFLEKELNKKHETPILINFDIDGLGYDNGDISYWMPNSWNKEIRSFFDNWTPKYLIPTIKYFGLFEQYFVSYMQDKLSLTGIANNGSLLERKVLLPEEFERLIIKRGKSELYFKNDSLLNIRLFQLLKKNNNREIVFFIPPYHESYLNSIKNYDSVITYLNLLEAIPMVSVLNYSHLKFSQNNYYNTTHLNYNGAMRFTNILKSDLINMGLIE
ncbi:MAG: hypothetical protein RL037_1945 [Bacteroidota bacterium]|jgi:hypothetical protein